eukprot:CAMPEP_0185280588 /NCGR_PEP_ID=MMETSP1359-20130426/66219_1 /TAXON_ID=552665 /ORGANISM="Bigelowiella longifila, Strain CCMP242" /LENGTH=416 /DNA_ID=CAMNT_0027875873 /DNA_START=87 /DNA_END=1338 /DNA_ORIENTATION=+
MGNCCTNAGKLYNSYCGCGGYCIRDQASFLYANLVNSNTRKESSDYGAISNTENHTIDHTLRTDSSKDITSENLNRLSLDESTVSDSEDLRLSAQSTQIWHDRRHRRDSNEENVCSNNTTNYVSYQKGDLQPSVENNLHSTPCKGDSSRKQYQVEVTQPRCFEDEEEKSMNNFELDEDKVVTRRTQSTSPTKMVKERRTQSTSPTKMVKESLQKGTERRFLEDSLENQVEEKDHLYQSENPIDLSNQNGKESLQKGTERRFLEDSLENQVEEKDHLYQSAFAEQKSQTGSTKEDEAAADNDANFSNNDVTVPEDPTMDSERIECKIATNEGKVFAMPTTSVPSMSSSYEEFRRHRVSVGDNDDDSRASVRSESDDEDNDLYDRTNKDIKMIDAALRMLEEARPLQSLKNLLVAAAE